MIIAGAGGRVGRGVVDRKDMQQDSIEVKIFM